MALDGATLSSYWALPFLGVLCSIALGPLVLSQVWHHHYGKISALWTLGVIVALTVTFGSSATFHTLAETLLHHYVPFIIFIMSLYVICGGIRLSISAKATPFFNTFFLGITSFIASWVGTTGAAMLFIRPLMDVNQHRSHQSHTIFFFIILICNIGGCLTAIGDPPLFLGFLSGVPFFWPMEHLLLPFLTLMIPLLGIYYLLDRHFFRREEEAFKKISDQTLQLTVHGFTHIIYLFGAIVAILLSGFMKDSPHVSFLGIDLKVSDLVRDGVLVALTLLSLKTGPQRPRHDNDFSWGPFQEICILFAAIFMTAAPVLAMLKAGSDGVFAPLVDLVNTPQGPNNDLYFWLSGMLSAFLDNAPTYLVFFNLAGGDAVALTTTHAKTLMAISCGAVFMGALTYIGNAPNFMVKAIAESRGVTLPSFLMYFVYALLLLLPLFALTDYLWF